MRSCGAYDPALTVAEDHDLWLRLVGVGPVVLLPTTVLEYRIQIFTETVGALDPILESLEGEISEIALGEEGDSEAAFRRLERQADAAAA